jgi:hypothetical protein
LRDGSCEQYSDGGFEDDDQATTMSVVDRVVAAGDAQLERTLEVARARAQEAEEKSRAEAAIRIQAAARRRCVQTRCWLRALAPILHSSLDLRVCRLHVS